MDYKKYYRDRTYQENESHFKNIFTTRFKIAKKFIKNPGNVLDIGSSTGVMLDIFKEYNWKTWGVEPSESAKIAISKGHKISSEYFEDSKLPNNYFDLVIMNHTLEHLENPKMVLGKIYKLLKKDGVVLIDVPNAGGIASKIMKNKWPYRLPKEHVNQFTKKNLSKLFKENNFEVIHFESRSGIFEFDNPVKEIWQALIGKKKRFFTEIINIPYDIFVTFFDAGDSMTMVGKKI
ncbi:hypothetical protein BH10PAT1_BH10PAT1_3040 [soil metagenome]